MFRLRRTETPPISLRRSIGASRSEVNKAYSRRKTDSPNKTIPDQESRGVSGTISRRPLPRRFMLAGAVALLVLAVLALRVSTHAQVIVLNPAGFVYSVRNQDQYIQVASKALGSSLYNQLKITMSNQDVGNYIEARMPEVSTVSVIVPFFGSTPKVYIQLKEPRLMMITPTGSYLLDKQGELIAPASVLTTVQQAHLTQVQDPGAGAGRIGQIMLTPNNVSFIRLLSAGLAVKSIKVTKMIMIPGAH